MYFPLIHLGVNILGVILVHCLLPVAGLIFDQMVHHLLDAFAMTIRAFRATCLQAVGNVICEEENWIIHKIISRFEFCKHDLFCYRPVTLLSKQHVGIIIWIDIKSHVLTWWEPIMGYPPLVWMGVLDSYRPSFVVA